MATQAQILSRELIFPAHKALHLSRTFYNSAPFMQNKPNFLHTQINLTPVMISRYESLRLPIPRENKPNQPQSQPPHPVPSKTTTAQPSRAPFTLHEPRFTRLPLATAPHHTHDDIESRPTTVPPTCKICPLDSKFPLTTFSVPLPLLTFHASSGLQRLIICCPCNPYNHPILTNLSPLTRAQRRSHFLLVCQTFSPVFLNVWPIFRKNR